MDSGSVALYQAVLEDVCPYVNVNYIAGEISDRYAEKTSLKPDVGVTRVAALLRSLFSKFEDEVLPTADEAALAKFLDCNERCGCVDTQPESELDAILLGEYRGCLAAFFEDYHKDAQTWITWCCTFDQLSDAARHGPGAAQGAQELSAYAKTYSSTLTATSEYLLSMFEWDSARFDHEAEAQVLRSAVHGERVVNGNILAFVPKKRTISRVTCTEAIVNMYYQLGLGSLFENRLRYKFAIDFHGVADDAVRRFIAGDPLFSKSKGKFIPSQSEYNAYLARRGSIDGSFATIDLVSASDTIRMSRLADCPKSVQLWIKALRSKETTLPDGRVVPLNMISTMGNGFTFALQTIIFSCAVRAAYRTLGIPCRNRSRVASNRYYAEDRGNWGVFGDDIVVVREAYDTTCRILHLLGFEVNLSKSFNDGLFRESCGSDWLKGQFVRGIYIHSLKTLQDKFVAFNRLAYWSCYTGMPLTRSLNLISSWIPPKDRLPIPLHEADDAGIKVPMELRSYHRETDIEITPGWGDFLTRPLDPARGIVVSRRLTKHSNYQSAKYLCYRSRGLTYRLSDVTSSYIKVYKQGKWRFLVHCPTGILEQLLRGNMRDGLASSRLPKPIYQKTYAESSCWNYSIRPPGDLRPLVGLEEITLLFSGLTEPVTRT